MKKNSYIKILLLFIGVLVRLQASEDNMTQAASLMQAVSDALTNVRYGQEPNINETFKDQAQAVMVQFPEITGENIAEFVFNALNLYSENQSKVTGKPVGEITKDFSERLQQPFFDLLESTPAFQDSQARYQVFKLLKEGIFDTLDISFDSKDLEYFLEQETLTDLKKITSNPAENQADLLKLAKDFIKSSFVSTNDPMQDFIQLGSIYDNLNKLGDSESLDNAFMNKKIDFFISRYPDFFKKIENYSSASALFDNLLKENKNFKRIIAIAELIGNLNQINIKSKDNKTLIAEYLSLKTAYDEILENYPQDRSLGDLKKLFDSKITTYTDLQVVKEYQEKTSEYVSGLAAFLGSPTIENAQRLKLLTKYSYNKVAFVSKETPKELKKAILKSSLDPLSKLIINNILIKKYDTSVQYPQAIESLFKTFDLRLDVSKVENFLETGTLPKDRWFKNVFTKMKRAFGLSKDVDIVDVTNLLKNLNKSKLLNAQSPDAVTKELQAALLKDPALMYKLLPENAKYFIKQFDNIKDFKNKLLEAYYQDKVVNDAAFESSDYQVSKRAKASTNLIRKAIELGLSSNEREAIIVELKDTFPRAFRLSYDGFDLTASIVEGLKAGNVELPVNMLSYQQKQNQTSVPDGLGGLGGAGDRWLNSPGKFTVSRLQPIAADPGKGGGYEWPISENNDPVLGGFLSGDNSPALRLQTGADL